MHHVAIDEWSRGRSLLHARDPRAKTIALAVFLVVLATSDRGLPLYLALLLAATALARLPLPGVLRRAAVVLPFCAAFAAVSALAGDWDRA
ncbi:MAG: hypothetical protein ACRD96_13425, partial [Bryobacteraceae bacterium]